MNTIGSRIKAIRGKLRQDAFANKIGMHINTVGRWERGQRTPDVNDLNRILQACPDISPAWLLTGEGEKIRHTQTDIQKITNYAAVITRRIDYLVEELTWNKKQLDALIDELKAYK